MERRACGWLSSSLPHLKLGYFAASGGAIGYLDARDSTAGWEEGNAARLLEQWVASPDEPRYSGRWGSSEEGLSICPHRLKTKLSKSFYY